MGPHTFLMPTEHLLRATRAAERKQARRATLSALTRAAHGVQVRVVRRPAVATSSSGASGACVQWSNARASDLRAPRTRQAGGWVHTMRQTRRAAQIVRAPHTSQGDACARHLAAGSGDRIGWKLVERPICHHGRVAGGALYRNAAGSERSRGELRPPEEISRLGSCE